MERHQLETDIRLVEEIPVLTVTGEIDVYTAPTFKQAVVNLAGEGHNRVVIDLHGVSFMDSSGFGALLGATKRLRPEGGGLRLIGVNRTIQRMLHLTRLDTVIPIDDTVEAAVAGFNVGHARAA